MAGSTETSLSPGGSPKADVLHRLSLPEIRARLQAASGGRLSPRILTAAEIVHGFSVFGEFSRREVAREYAHVGLKQIDRALLHLEACGALRCLKRNKAASRGGATYAVLPLAHWHRYDPRLAAARKSRAGRGRAVPS